MRRRSVNPPGVVDDASDLETPRSPVRARRRKLAIGIGVLGAGAAVIAGVTVASADPNAPRTGVRAPALYVAADGSDSHTDGGLDFSGNSTGVNAANGNLVIHELDDPVADANGSFSTSVFNIDRWYNGRLAARRDLGRGWTTGLGYDVRLDTSSSTQVVLVAPSEHVITFPVDASDGPFTATDDTNYTLRRIPNGWAADNHASGRTLVFDSNGNLQRIDDPSGQSERFDYTSAGGQNRLSAVYGPDGKAFRFSFNGNGQFIEVDNPQSGHGYYGYSGELLTRATHPDGKISDYGYDGSQRLTSVTRPGYQLSVSYDAQGRVSSFTETKGSSPAVTATLTYRAPQPGTCNPGRDASQTDVVSTSGSSKSYCFDNNGDLANGASDADLPEQTIPLGNRTWDLADVDADGIADLALVDRDTGAISARLGSTTGVFGAETAFGSFGHTVKDIAASDVDGFDQNIDTLALDTADVISRAPDNTLDYRFSTGGGTIPLDPAADPRQTTWPADRTLNLADVDADGSADLWAVDAGDVRIALGNANGFASTTTWGSVPSGVTTLLADMDDNGTDDLVTYNPDTGAIRVGLAPVDGSAFDPLVTWGTGPLHADVAAGNLTGSGPRDLYFRLTDGTVLARATSSSGSISSTSTPLGILPTDYQLHAVDVTGDGPASVVGTKETGGNLLVREINVAAITGEGS